MLRYFKNLRETSNEEGFTLIELMIVVVIIGILAAIAIPIFMNQQKAAIQAGVKSDVRNLQLSVATYLVKNPTAANLDWRYQSGARSGLLASDPNWVELTKDFNPSQSTTILAVRLDAEPSRVGNWKQYYILGANMTDAPDEGSVGYYRYIFDSLTGTYTEISK